MSLCKAVIYVKKSLATQALCIYIALGENWLKYYEIKV
jgi:hypothetical protein